MEKTNDTNEGSQHEEPMKLDSPEAVAAWMREADYAFDFRGSDLWSLKGGISISDYNTDVINK